MPDRILLEVLYENPIDREIPEIYMDKRIEVRYTPKEEYDRAGSRDAIIRELDSDIVIFMVQTAIPQNRYLVEKLTEPFKEDLFQPLRSLRRQMMNAVRSSVV